MKATENRIEIPYWLHEYAVNLVADARVVSVVLFGSRVNGLAREDSDWDVAVLHTKSRRVWREINLGQDIPEARQVDYVPFPHEEYASHLNAIGSLGYELTHNGVLLAGEPLLDPLPAEHDVIDTDELTMLLRNAYVNLSRTITEIRHENPAAERLDGQYARDSSRYSGDTAEYLAKALCTYYELGYAKIHNLAALAEELPSKLRERVLSMNGGNTARHVSHYETEPADGEFIGDVLARVDTIFEILDETAQSMFSKLSYVEVRDVLAAIQPRIKDMARLQEDSSGIWSDLASRYRKHANALAEYITELRTTDRDRP